MHTTLGLALLAVYLLTAPASAAEPPLQSLARKLVGDDHGVFVQAENGAVLAALNSTRPYHPASVTKVATTLAFLSRMGPDRRFRTKMLAAGPITDGTLHGDLVVQAEGDPYFLFENAFLVLLRLRAKGVRRVNGAIRVEGPFFFDWTPDLEGRRLKRAWTGRLGTERWPVVTGALFPGKSMPLKDFTLGFGRGVARESRPPRVLVGARLTALAPPPQGFQQPLERQLPRVLLPDRRSGNGSTHPSGKRDRGASVVHGH